MQLSIKSGSVGASRYILSWQLVVQRQKVLIRVKKKWPLVWIRNFVI